MSTNPPPAWLATDLALWAEADLPVFPYRATHPHVARARTILAWLAEHAQLNDWRDIRGNMVVAFCRAHPHLKHSTVTSYVKSLRRWLRWHERNDFDAPLVSTRLQRLAPRSQYSEPRALTPDEQLRLRSRSVWVFDGCRSLYFQTTAGRRKLAHMRDWPPGFFHAFVELGLQLGLRPWEAALLSWGELHLDGAPYIRLQGNELRPLKTSLASTPLRLSADLARTLRALPQTSPWVFAVPCDRSRNGWRAPNYDSIWRALSQELGIPGLNARSLRRTFATNLARAETDLWKVARATRHLRLQTLQHYVEVAGGRVVDPLTGELDEIAGLHDGLE